MPSKSKAQQGLMGAVHAAKKGEKPASPEVAKIAKGMTNKAAKDFAGTKHRGLPQHVAEERTEVKDKDGKVISWKDEGEWKKSTKKDARGRVTNLSDKARRETEKTSKAEKEMAEAFETAMEGSIRGGVWTSQKPDKGQKDVPPPQEDDMGSAYPAKTKAVPKAAPKPVKKAEVEPSETDTELAEAKKEKEPEGTYSKKRFETDGQRVARLAKEKRQAEKKKADEKVAEGKPTAKKGKSVAAAAMWKNKAKALKENIDLISGMIAEAKKEKCTCSTNEDTCKVHGMKSEGLKGGQKKLDVAPPKGKLTGADFKALKSKKVKEATDEKCNHTPKGKKCPVHGLKECSGMYEGSKVDQNDDGKNDFEDVKIARMKAAMKGKKKAVKESLALELVQIARTAMNVAQLLKEGKSVNGWETSIMATNEYLTKLQAKMSQVEEQVISAEDAYMGTLREHLNSLKG